MNKNTLTFLLLGLLVILFGYFLFIKGGSRLNSQEMKQLILFYSVGCPHCVKVEEFIRENKIKEKIDFEEKEVGLSKENAKKLIEVAKKCGFNENEIGVPFLWDGENQKCVVGDEPIINFFKEKLNL